MDAITRAMLEELDRLRELVKQAYYEGYMDGAAYSGSHSMFFLWRHSESLGNLEEEE